MIDKIVKFTLCAGDKNINKFMAAADMRPDYKTFGSCYILSGTLGDGATVQSVFNKTLEVIKTKYDVVFFYAHQKYKGRQLFYYDGKTKVFSDGETEHYLTDLVSQMSIKSEASE